MQPHNLPIGLSIGLDYTSSTIVIFKQPNINQVQKLAIHIYCSAEL